MTDQPRPVPTPEEMAAEILGKGQRILDHGEQKVMFTLSTLKWNLIGAIQEQREALPEGLMCFCNHEFELHQMAVCTHCGCSRFGPT